MKYFENPALLSYKLVNLEQENSKETQNLCIYLDVMKGYK